MSLAHRRPTTAVHSGPELDPVDIVAGAEVRSGSVTYMTGGITDYNAVIPAGRVGVWAGSAGGAAKVQFDDFVVRSLAANAVVDGRFTDDVGNVQVSSGKLEFYNSDGTTRRTVLRHVRMSEGIVQVDLTWKSIDSGIILNYQDPENFGVMLLIDAGASALPAYVEYVNP